MKLDYWIQLNEEQVKKIAGMFPEVLVEVRLPADERNGGQDRMPEVPKGSIIEVASMDVLFNTDAR